MKKIKIFIFVAAVLLSETALGQHNTVYGTYAGASLSTGNRNTFMGFAAGQATNTGNDNVFIGVNAGVQISSGTYNTFMGRGAGEQNTTGQGNLFLGTFAGLGNITGSYNVFLGYNAGNLETGSNKLYIANNGTATPLIYGEFDTQKLRVNGTISTKELTVEIAFGSGPDYVFEDDYELRSLSDTREFIKEHKHLPEVPSAREMESSGISVGEMNLLLLKKVEELTLHLIRQEEQLEALRMAISEMKNN